MGTGLTWRGGASHQVARRRQGTGTGPVTACSGGNSAALMRVEPLRLGLGPDNLSAWKSRPSDLIIRALGIGSLVTQYFMAGRSRREVRGAVLKQLCWKLSVRCLIRLSAVGPPPRKG
jgi:hypothetical protein